MRNVGLVRRIPTARHTIATLGMVVRPSAPPFERKFAITN
jgi:hypothetical protein